MKRKVLHQTRSATKHPRRSKQLLTLTALEARDVPAIMFLEDFQSFTAAGFSPNPAAGQLDSDFWSGTGSLANGDVNFGGTAASGTDYGRGVSAVAVTSGGVYALTETTNTTFGVQPTADDFTPGTFTLRVQNDGNPAADPVISYDLFARLDGDRANTFNVSYSTDGSTFTPLPALDYTSPAALVSGAPYTLVGNKTETLTGVNLAANDFFYLRWTTNDVSGSGSRDEFGIDKVSVIANSGTGVATTTAITSITPTTVNLGENVTFSATVTVASGTDTPVGTVNFKSGSTVLASGSVTGSGTTGTVTVNTTSIPQGSYSDIIASFAPSGAFTASNSAPFAGTLTVNAVATTAALTSSAPNPSPGPSITFTATISGTSTPTGTVDFFANGVKLNDTAINLNGSGQASFNVSTAAIQAVDGKTLTPGINDVSVVYNPTGIFLASSKAIPQKVKPNAFGVGNVLVYRTGDGINAMTANGNRFYIDEYLPGAGQTDPVQSVLMPTIADGDNKPVLASGVQSTEADLTLSPDGQYLYFTAYNALPTNTSTLTFANGTTIPRVIGRLNLVTGAIDTSMGLTDLASGGAVRSVAVAADGSLYATGATGGIRYVPAYSAATTTSTGLGSTTLSWQSVAIYGTPAQLYGVTLPTATSPFAPKLSTIGAGLPTSGTPAATPFPGIPLDNSQPNPEPDFPVEFFGADLSPTVAADASGIDTIYISENGPSFAGGTITKWSWEPGALAWVLNSTINPPLGGIPGVDNSFNRLTASVSSGTVNLIIDNGAGGTNNGGGTIWSLTDSSGHNAPLSSTTLTQVAQVGLGTNKAFRGVAIVPNAAPVAPVVSSIVVNGGALQRSKITTVQVNFATPVDASIFQAGNAVSFTRTGIPTSGVGAIGTVVNNSNGLIIAPASGTVSSITLTFANTQNAGIDFGSLADGRWQLAIPAASYLSPNGPTDIQLRRLFGNENNDTLVDAGDFGFFPQFGASPGSIFDFNNDASIDAGDLSEFGNRFGYTLV